MADFEISGERIARGTRRTVDIPVSVFSDHTPVHLSAHVVHGKRPGPVMFVSAGIHGDEVIGMEIVRRLLKSKPLGALRGTLIAVPIVNTFGFLNHSRYLPDRRDLNRCFPGTTEGSMASRLAHIFMEEIVARADFGIDLHSAAIHRTNLPQIRLTPGNARLEEMGRAFAAPVMMQSSLRDGSLRMAAEEMGCDVLLYEAGEGLRFDEVAARAGVAGILRVMNMRGMVGHKGIPKARGETLMCEGSTWARAPAGGLFRGYRGSGEMVVKGDVLGGISDPFGELEYEVIAPWSGVVVGRTMLPVVNEGDALFHIGRLPTSADEPMEPEHHAPRLLDEDEII